MAHRNPTAIVIKVLLTPVLFVFGFAMAGSMQQAHPYIAISIVMATISALVAIWKY